jgi:hypothetical protein
MRLQMFAIVMLQATTCCWCLFEHHFQSGERFSAMVIRVETPLVALLWAKGDFMQYFWRSLVVPLLLLVLVACNGTGTPPQFSNFDPLTLELAGKTNEILVGQFSFKNTGGSDLAYTATVAAGGEWLKISEGASATVKPNSTQIMKASATCPTTPSTLSTSISLTATGLSGSKDLVVNLKCTAPDTVPNGFSFTPVNNAELAMDITSNEVTITGIDSPTPISADAGAVVLVNNNIASVINNNDKLSIRLKSSGAFATSVASNVNVGGVVASFVVTTKAEPKLSLSLNPAVLTLKRGESGNSSASIVREGFTGAVVVTATPINGITADALAIAADQTSATLKINAAATAEIGQFDLPISASGGGKTANGKITVTVIGSSPTPISSGGYQNIVALVGQPIASQMPTIMGGTTPYSVSIDSALPTGLALDTSTGGISGTPSVVAAQKTYTITISDSSTPAQTLTKTLDITVNPVLGVKAAYSNVNGTIGFDLKNPGMVLVEGGTPPYSYSIAPALPAGIGLDAATGKITGKPTVLYASTSHNVTIKDSDGTTVTSPVKVSVAAVPEFVKGYQSLINEVTDPEKLPQTPETIGGALPLSFSISPDLTAKTGIGFDPKTGIIAGAPTKPVLEEKYTVTASDENGASAVTNFRVLILPRFAPKVVDTSIKENQVVNTNLKEIKINFNKSVNASLDSMILVCDAQNIAFDGLPIVKSSTTTLLLKTDLPQDSTCILTVLKDQVSDLLNPPLNMEADFVLTFKTDAAPDVTTFETIPGAGALANGRVGTNINIKVSFTEPVDVVAAGMTLTCGASNITFTGLPATNSSSLIIDPLNDLPQDTTCTLTVLKDQVSDSDTADLPDTMNQNRVFSFKTDIAPDVAAFAILLDGADVPDGIVSTAVDIKVSFTEPVAVVAAGMTLTCGAGNIAFAGLPATNSSSLIIDPLNDLPQDTTCTLTVLKDQVSDSDTADLPDAMNQNRVFSFKTDAAPDATGIETTASADPSQSSRVSVGSDIKVNFSESVAVANAGVTLVCGVTNVGFSGLPTVSDASSMVLDPSNDLPDDSLCTLTVLKASVSDSDSADVPDQMNQNRVFTFTTEQLYGTIDLRIGFDPAQLGYERETNMNPNGRKLADVTITGLSFPNGQTFSGSNNNIRALGTATGLNYQVEIADTFDSYLNLYKAYFVDPEFIGFADCTTVNVLSKTYQVKVNQTTVVRVLYCDPTVVRNSQDFVVAPSSAGKIAAQVSSIVPASLRDVVANVSNSTTVTFLDRMFKDTSNTIMLNGGPITINKNLNIFGWGRSFTIVKPDGVVDTLADLVNERIFQIESATPQNVDLRSFTIQDGIVGPPEIITIINKPAPITAQDVPGTDFLAGGCILGDATDLNLTLTEMAVNNCRAMTGGGIAFVNDTLLDNNSNGLVTAQIDPLPSVLTLIKTNMDNNCAYLPLPSLPFDATPCEAVNLEALLQQIGQLNVMGTLLNSQANSNAISAQAFPEQELGSGGAVFTGLGTYLVINEGNYSNNVATLSGGAIRAATPASLFSPNVQSVQAQATAPAWAKIIGNSKINDNFAGIAGAINAGPIAFGGFGNFATTGPQPQALANAPRPGSELAFAQSLLQSWQSLQQRQNNRSLAAQALADLPIDLEVSNNTTLEGNSALAISTILGLGNIKITDSVIKENKGIILKSVFLLGISNVTGNQIKDNISLTTVGGGLFVFGSFNVKNNTISGHELTNKFNFNNSEINEISLGGGLFAFDLPIVFLLNMQQPIASVVSNNIIENNTAYFGGGAYLASIVPNLQVNRVIAPQNGLFPDLGIKFDNNIVRNNGAFLGGGVCINNCFGEDFIQFPIESPESFYSLTGNTINNNVAQYGGGIYAYLQDIKQKTRSANLLLVNNTVSGNMFGFDGGGIYLDAVFDPPDSGTTQLNVGMLFNTIYSNTPAVGAINTDGGGLYVDYIAPNVPNPDINLIAQNNIFAANSATTNPQTTLDTLLSPLNFINAAAPLGSLANNTGLLAGATPETIKTHLPNAGSAATLGIANCYPGVITDQRGMIRPDMGSNCYFGSVQPQ